MIRLSNSDLPEPSDLAGANSFDAAMDDAMSQRGAAPRQNAFRVIHGLLRGRYHWVIILGVVFGTVLAYLGYKHGSPIYTSSGSIRVNYVVPTLLYDNAETGMLPGFDAYVEAQAAAMTSRPVIEAAVNQPQWLKIRSVPDDLSMISLSSRLTVTTKTDVVQVEASDRNPETAFAAVSADLEAYQQIYITQQTNKDETRINDLRSFLEQDNGKLKTIQNAMAEVAKAYGSENIDPIYVEKRAEYEKLYTQIQELQTEIAIGSIDPTKPPLGEISDQALGFLDTRLGSLYDRMADSKLHLTHLLENYGEKSYLVLSLRSEINGLQQQINDRVAELRKAAASGINMPGMAQVPTRMQIDGMKAHLAVLEKQEQPMYAEMIKDGQDDLKMADLHATALDIQKEMEGVTQRIQELVVEKPSQKRVEIVSTGEMPLAPDKDTRPRNAAAGGVGGFILALSTVLTIGLINARLHAPQDFHVRLGSRPILGVVPMLADGPDFAKRAAIAAECVHSARNMLEIWGRGNKHLVIGVTSPSFGSGNTSLSMSLGVSFAAAGLRTLLIDCDFVSGGLTNRLQAVVRRDLATVLQRTGLVSETQIHHAMRVAAQTSSAPGASSTAHRSLGEVCVDLGYLTSAELEAALARQASDTVGILNSLGGEPLQACVATTGIRNLSVLPLGSATSAHSAKICSQALRQVLETARQQYDTIIIDTRSILGSLEASIVASAVDGMVLTVARGEQRSHFRDALARLKTLCCPVAGVIFNQALPEDIPSIARLNRPRTDDGGSPDGGDPTMEPAGRLATLGPLPRATISCVPTAKEGTELC
jgi:Mrp family chromosome partitioning ATPase/uncharacterized protein involved in exopolysaccharide biosynthesis